MAVVLVVAAFAIDTSAWYQKHHQAQVAADAASLAAANCLANAGTGNTCTSTTDTVDAAQVATVIAAANGLTIPTTDVTFSNGKVSVLTPSTSPTLFAKVAGIKTATTSANAIAAYTGGSSSNTCTSTAQAAGDCYAMFAADSSCSGTGVSIQTTDLTVNGAIRSNGVFNISAEHGGYFANVSYGCSPMPSYPSGNSFGPGQPTQQGGVQSWPEDYTSAFPLTNGNFTAGGDPNCTQIGTSLTLQSNGPTLTNNTTYCYQSITFDENDLTCTSCTFVASQSMSFQQGSGDNLTPKYKDLLFYDMGSDNPQIIANGNSFLTSGATEFFPNSSVLINSPLGAVSGFVEAKDISTNGGTNGTTWTGTGPATTTTTIPGSDSLLQ